MVQNQLKQLRDYSKTIECLNKQKKRLKNRLWRLRSMGELVEFIAKALVDNPDEVSVNEVEGSQSIIIELKVASEDMGKIIGKQGRIAKAIRTVVKAAAIKDNK